MFILFLLKNITHTLIMIILIYQLIHILKMVEWLVVIYMIIKNIKNEPLLNKLSDYLLDNISNITSSTKIENYLKNDLETGDHKTISNYLDYLCNAFAFYRVRRYDIKGKTYLKSQDKYYLVDTSFRRAIL